MALDLTRPAAMIPAWVGTFWNYLHWLGTLLYRAALQWQADRATRLSAAVAMYSILSLSPLVVISIKILSLILGAEAASTAVHHQLQSLLGPLGVGAASDMLTYTSRHGTGVWATVISVCILLFTASGVFAELRDSLNDIWGIKPKAGSGWWAAVRDRFESIGMVFVIGFLLLVSQALTTIFTAMSHRLAGSGGWVAFGIDLVVSLIVITLLFGMLFRFLADARLGWRAVIAGAFVTAVLFKIGQYLEALYFTYASTASAYGAAGTFVVVLLWVYYSCWILFYGAELIQVHAQMRGTRIAPDEDARKVPRGSQKWQGGNFHPTTGGESR
jgi:membrane protein